MCVSKLASALFKTLLTLDSTIRPTQRPNPSLPRLFANVEGACAACVARGGVTGASSVAACRGCIGESAMGQLRVPAQSLLRATPVAVRGALVPRAATVAIRSSMRQLLLRRLHLHSSSPPRGNTCAPRCELTSPRPPCVSPAGSRRTRRGEGHHAAMCWGGDWRSIVACT